MICKECPYKKEFQRYGNATSAVSCEHPNKEHINQYFKEHGIQKMQGFLGFTNCKGDFPIKKSPKWCPLKIAEKGGCNNA